jgi:5'-3' exonuclease
MPVYLIDASIYIFRAWFSLPDRWHTQDGFPLNAVYGYAAFLLDLLEEVAAGQEVIIAAAFDESLRTCFRNKLYADYKQSRELPDEALALQLRCCRELTEVLCIASYGGIKYEADDYIGSLARLAREQGLSCCVVSRDKDLGQLLLGPQDTLWDAAGGGRMQRGEFTEKFGVAPEQLADYLALVGDPGDDIPGVPGIGAKTAAQLLQTFGSLDQLRYRFDQLSQSGIRGAARISQNLQHSWGQALLARSLVQLAEQIEGVTVLPAAYRLRAEPLLSLQDWLLELGITGPLPARCGNLAQRVAAS